MSWSAAWSRRGSCQIDLAESGASIARGLGGDAPRSEPQPQLKVCGSWQASPLLHCVIKGYQVKFVIHWRNVFKQKGLSTVSSDSDWAWGDHENNYDKIPSSPLLLMLNSIYGSHNKVVFSFALNYFATIYFYHFWMPKNSHKLLTGRVFFATYLWI
jgi:hypothetical protein